MAPPSKFQLWESSRRDLAEVSSEYHFFVKTMFWVHLGSCLILHEEHGDFAGISALELLRWPV